MSPDKFIRWLLANRVLIFVGLGLLTVAAAISATRLRADNSIETWFLASDPALETYDRFSRQFAGDELVMIALFADDVLAPSTLALVERLATAIERLEHVHRVQSIIDSPIADRSGGFRDSAFRDAILASPLQTGTLLKPDAGATAIVIHYARSGNTFAEKRAFVATLERLTSELTRDSGVRTAITGGTVLNKVSLESNERDVTVLVPVMLLVILAITWSVFRRLLSAILPLLVVTIALTWTFGFMAIMGWRFTMISSILVPLILAVGVADAIHLAARYGAQVGQGLDRPEAMRTSFRQLLRPCWLTTATTAFGLLSLLVSELQPIREFAVTAAFGVVAAFLVSMTMLPAALTLPKPDRDLHRYTPGLPLRQLASLAQRRRGSIVLAAAVIGALAAWMAARVEVELDPMSWLPDDSAFREQTRQVDAAFGGTLAIEFLLNSESGRFAEPAVLRRLEAFQQWLTDNTSLNRTMSVADLVKEATRMARDAGSEGYELPRTVVITQTMLEGMTRRGELGNWLSDDWSVGRISARLSLAEASALVGELPAIERQVKTAFEESGIDVEITGHAKLVGDMQHYVVDSQLRSFSVAVLVVAALLVLQLRSLRLGLLAMIPNLLPIVIGIGAMWLLGIPLNPGTVMVAAVAMGIVVDDSVHFLAAYQRHRVAGAERQPAVTQAVIDVGRPVIITSTLLAVGFLVLLLGSFQPSQQIGQIVAIVVAAAMLSDLLFLPALLNLGGDAVEHD